MATVIEGVVAVAAPPTDGAGFVDWVRPHLVAMGRLAARLAPGVDRDDVVQEALARAWVKRAQYDPERGAPSAWLLAITADQARKAVRRLRPVTPLPEHDAVAPGRGAAARLDAAGRLEGEPRLEVEARLDVEQALAGLSERQRLAVDCYYFADLSVADTAAVMGCSEGTVKSTLSDARARLRGLLEVTE